METAVQKIEVMRNGRPRQTVTRINPNQKGESTMETKKNGNVQKAKPSQDKVTPPKPKEEKKKESKGSMYDHREGSQALLIDNLLIKGCKLESAIKALKDVANGKDDSWAKSRFMSHVKHLRDDHKLTIADKDEFFKIEKGGEKK